MLLSVSDVSAIGTSGPTFDISPSGNILSNDGKYCGRLKFTATNPYSYSIDIEIWSKLTSSSGPYSFSGISLSINPNSSNQLTAVTSGDYSYYAVFTKTSDLSFISNTSGAPIRGIVYALPTITSQVSNSDIQTCLNIAPNNLSVFANAGSGTI